MPLKSSPNSGVLRIPQIWLVNVVPKLQILVVSSGSEGIQDFSLTLNWGSGNRFDPPSAATVAAAGVDRRGSALLLSLANCGTPVVSY